MSCSVTLRVTHDGTKWGETLAVTGRSDALGNWRAPVPMVAASFPEWIVTLNGLSAGTLYEYKYVLSAGPGAAIACWECLSDSPSGNRSFIAADGLCIDDQRWGATRTDDPALLAVRSPPRPVSDPSSTASNSGDSGPSSTSDSATSFAGPSSAPGHKNTASNVQEGEEESARASAAADRWTLPEVADYLQRELFLAVGDVREARERLRTSRPASEQAGVENTGTVQRPESQHAAQSASTTEDPDSAISSDEALQIARTLVDDTKLSVQDVRAALVAARSAAAAKRRSWNSSPSDGLQSGDPGRGPCLLAFGAAVALAAAVLVADPIAKYAFA
jgi:hypothetical protein